MERNNPVNSVYLITLASVSLILFVNSFYTALFFSIVTVSVFLIGICIVSMIEKIAAKHIKFIIFALVSAGLITIFKVVCGYMNIEYIVKLSKNIEIAIVPCLMLAIIPIYFENKLSVRQYFYSSLLMCLIFAVMIILHGTITEIVGYGMFMRKPLKMEGFEFFTKPYGSFILLATLCVIFNMVRRGYLKKTKKFEMLTDRYKLQIAEIKDTKDRENSNKEEK